MYLTKAALSIRAFVVPRATDKSFLFSQMYCQPILDQISKLHRGSVQALTIDSTIRPSFFDEAFTQKRISPAEEQVATRLRQYNVPVRTSIGRWDQKPFGLTFGASYLDILPVQHDRNRELATDLPVILYLTGWLGSHKPINQFLLQMADRTNCRVVAPLWPGLSDKTRGETWKDNELFNHSFNEYADFASDFLKAVNITTPLQSIVAHSGGVHAALLLAASNNAKSMALICPVFERPFARFGLPRLQQLLVKAWMRKESRNILRPCISGLLQASPLGKFFSADSFIAFNRACLAIKSFEPTLEVAAELHKRKMPHIVAYSDDDEWTSKASTWEIVERLELDPESSNGKRKTENYFMRDGKLIGAGGESFRECSKQQALRFVKGVGHWPQRKCPDLLIERIQTMINQI